MKRRSFGVALVELVILAVLVIAGGLIWINRQNFVDDLKALAYNPSAQMQSIEDKLELTSYGKQVLAATGAKLEDATAFNQSCDQAKETNNPVLGCYSGGSIFVYSVNSQKLNGIEETTSAHELLHAVYARMSSSERAMINKELEAAYQRVKTTELEQRMAYYQKAEPGQADNELYSILGTEFHTVGPELEKHYALVFKNRQALVNFHDQYSSVFASLSQQANSLRSQINSLADSINQRTTSYNVAIKQLNTDISEFNQKSSNGGYISQIQFTTDRNNLIARSDELDKQRQSIQADVDHYNVLTRQYNAIATETNDLNADINSSLAPSPSI